MKTCQSVFLLLPVLRMVLTRSISHSPTNAIKEGNRIAPPFERRTGIVDSNTFPGDLIGENASPYAVKGALLIRKGYDNVDGYDPICWRGSGMKIKWPSAAETQSNVSHAPEHPLVADFLPLGQMDVLAECQGNLTVQGPVVNDDWPASSQLLRTNQVYNYTLQLTLNLTALMGHTIMSDFGPYLVAQIRLCSLNAPMMSGLCTPFLREERALAAASGGPSPTRTHVDSDMHFVNVDQNSKLFSVNLTMPTSVSEVGDYFVIGTVQFFTGDRYSEESASLPTHRWDVANALQPQRVVQYREPPQILQVSMGAKVISYIAIAVSTLVILFLMAQTLKHRKEHVLKLSQGDFLLVYLLCALMATISVSLAAPNNDLYCRLSNPMVLIRVQLMYAITAGRLWRINKVISPLLVEHLRGKSPWRRRIMGLLQCFAGEADKSPKLRPVVSTRQLAFMVAVFAMPQVAIQLCSLTIQPQWRTIEFNNEWTVGRTVCTNGATFLTDLVNYAFLVLGMLIVSLLFMAHSSRKLPSLFSETRVIYESTIGSLVLLVMGMVIVLLTDQPTTSPDVEYLVWLVVTLSITVNSSILIILPKLRMVWRGEVVIVSKLVSDHHRKNREKRMAKSGDSRPDPLLHNVSGISTSFRTSYVGSYAGSSNPHLDQSFSNTSWLNENYDIELGLDSSSNHTAKDEVKKPDRSAAFTESLSTDFSIDGNEGEGDDADLAGDDDTNVDASSRTQQSSKSHQESSGACSSLTADSPSSAGKGDSDKLVSHISSKTSKGQQAANTSRNARAADPPPETNNSISSSRIVVSQDEAPARRLVLKMIDLQEQLTSMNRRIMSGLIVSPSDWESLTRMTTALHRTFTESVDFEWRMNSSQFISSRQFSTIARHPAMPSESDDTIQQSNHQQQQRKRASKRSSSLAKEFRKCVDLRDRRYLLTVYKNCFVGSDAIDSMIYHGLCSSRDEAVTLGRQLAREQNLFSHVCGDHLFEDKKYFYHFLHDESDDLSCSSSDDEAVQEEEEEADDRDDSISMADFAETEELLARASAFVKHVDVADRSYRTQTYADCFVGADAIDNLVYSGIATSRWQAVQLGRTLARKLNLFSHVTGDHEFKDDYLFYSFGPEWRKLKHGDSSVGFTRLRGPLADKADAFRRFVEVGERKYHSKQYKNVFVGSEAVDSLLYNKIAATRDEAVALGRTLASELRLFRHVTNGHELKDEFLFFRFRDIEGASVFEGSNSMSGSCVDVTSQQQVLTEKAADFKQHFSVQDRKYHGRTYKRVFVGAEAVDSLIYAGIVSSRFDAVQLARALSTQLGLFRHVTGAHCFKDEFLFYRYQDDADGGSSTGGSVASMSVSTGAGSNTDDASLTADGASASQRSALLDKAEAFRECVQIKDRKYRLKTYKSCFVGSDAVDGMLKKGLAQSRWQAVQLGRTLARELKLLKHVTGDHPFSDEYLFFRFRDTFFIRESSASSSHGCSASIDTKDSNLAATTNNGGTTLGKSSENKLVDGATAFRMFVQVKDRSYRMKTYRRCFVGCEAVDRLLSAGVVATRDEAVELGVSLQHDFNLFQHVCGEHIFQDSYLFFRYLDDGGAELRSGASTTLPSTSAILSSIPMVVEIGDNGNAAGSDVPSLDEPIRLMDSEHVATVSLGAIMELEDEDKEE